VLALPCIHLALTCVAAAQVNVLQSEDDNMVPHARDLVKVLFDDCGEFLA